MHKISISFLLFISFSEIFYGLVKNASYIEAKITKNIS